MRLTDFTLFDDFAVQGNWWIPRRRARKMRGTLSFKHDGDITLSLGCRLVSPIPSRMNAEAIYGHTDSGDNCSIFPAVEVKSHSTHTGVITTEISADYLVVGAHAKSLRNIRVSTMSARFTNLDSWVGQPAITVGHASDPSGPLHTAEARRLPPAIEVRVESLGATIYSGSAFTFSGAGHRIEWRQRDYLSVTTDKPATGDWFLKRAHSIQRLLTLLIFSPVWPTEIVLKPERGENISVYPAQLVRNVRSNEQLMPHQMLTTLADIRACISDVANKWFRVEDALSPTVNLLLGTMSHPSLFVEFQFLSLMQAIESFHDRVSGGTYLPRREYMRIYKSIVASFPRGVQAGLRERLKSAIYYGNEYSLRKRVKDMLKVLPTELKDLVVPGSPKWADRVVDTRNYYTHYSPELKRKAFALEDVVDSIARLRVLLVVVLYRELGLSYEQIVEIIKRNYRLSSVLGR